PGSADSSPETSIVSLTSPRSARTTCTWRGRAVSASSALWQAAAAISAKALAIRTGRLLQVGERLLRGQRRVAAFGLRAVQLALRLQHGGERRAPQLPGGARHLQQLSGGGHQLFGERTGACGRGVPARARGS